MGPWYRLLDLAEEFVVAQACNYGSLKPPDHGTRGDSLSAHRQRVEGMLTAESHYLWSGVASDRSPDSPPEYGAPISLERSPNVGVFLASPPDRCHPLCPAGYTDAI
jgi:hypothetical protein